MAKKVTLERVGRPGLIRVDERVAPLLTKKGRFRRMDIRPRSSQPSQEQHPATEQSGYADMEYRELQRLVREREVEADGRAKDDLVAALEKADRYNRRDMRAED